MTQPTDSWLPADNTAKQQQQQRTMMTTMMMSWQSEIVDSSRSVGLTGFRYLTAPHHVPKDGGHVNMALGNNNCDHDSV